MTEMRVEFPYLMSDRDRHGNERFYVRRQGRKIRIRKKLGTEDFALAYADALRALEQDSLPRSTLKAAPGSFGWLAARYFQSPDFKRLDQRSQAARRLVIESCLREPRKPGSPDLMRDCPISVLSAAHVRMLRDRRAAQPGAANNRRKWLSSLFSWAVEHNLLRANPAREVRKIRYSSDGFHTWTVAEVRQYEARHPIGTKARLAIALLLYLGVRRGDVVKLGRQHEKDGWLRFVPSKTSYRRKRVSEKPMLKVLADLIAHSPTGDLTYLITNHGKPFTAAGFGNWFRDRCNEAGLPHCSAHGLRKAGATIAAENGATDRQLMALYDWDTAAQANVYTAAADRKRLAGEAARLLVGDQIENMELSHPNVPPKNSAGDTS
jgi:integrase